ncbi:MAG: ribonuclease HI [Treponema sp.]|jgi:ribonuclease HI|nr:ribonuclease HI [Treponema sp.]
MNSLKVYTDGSCLGNPGRGGWAFIILDRDTVCKEHAGAELYTTNNRMELIAVINALETVLSMSSSEVTVVTDSQYVKNGITAWIYKWKRNNWQTTSKTPVKNKELWQKLELYTQQLSVSWEWTKGHNGDKYNERCDFLARRNSSSL